MRNLIVAGCWMLAFTALQAGEMSEVEKRVEFAKAYAAAKPEERIAAVQLLSGAKEDASFLFLNRVAASDVEEAVRLSAFNLISEWDDPVGRLGIVVMELFRNEKSHRAKIAMAQTFPKLKIKATATEEAIKLLGRMIYIETYKNNWNNQRRNDNDPGDGTTVRQLSAEEIAARRRDFSAVLAVVNTLTGQSFPASNRAKEASKRWWDLHKSDFLKADAEMLVKLRDEAQAAATKKAATTEKE